MEQANYTYDKKRFETFIDAVIAIIMTILVLELKIPEEAHHSGLSTREQLIELLPSFVSYIGSFLLITGIWVDHHILYLNLHRLTKRYILLTMLFILSLSILPFTTAFAGNNYKDSFAVALLFGNYVVMNVFFSFLYMYADWKGILSAQFVKDSKKVGIYSMIGIVGLIIAVPLAYVNTYISFTMGLLIFGGHLAKKK